MKFTLSWLKDHLDTAADAAAVGDAMTMAGLEVEEVSDPTVTLAPFTVARIVSAARHPDADRLQVCQVETVDGMKEIVCGAPNARAGLVTIYAPIGAYVPGLDVTLVEKPVRGVVSNGMLCSAAELELAGDSDGILDLDASLPVGTPAAAVFGVEPVIDFEVTPNRPDWLGVDGIARDLAAAGLGTLTTAAIEPVKGQFPCSVAIRLEAPGLCPVFAGRVIRGVRNGPSPEWLQRRLTATGLRSINRLVDVTNLLAYDRARPLHVYDLNRLEGRTVVARGGTAGESVLGLDGKTYATAPDICVIADADGGRAIGLGGVMGGETTGCDGSTTDVFLESAWFDPLATAQTGRTLGISSDAQYRFARRVDPETVVPGIELATRLILDLCGGEASEVVMAGEPPAAPVGFAFDPTRVGRLTGLDVTPERTADVLTALGFVVDVNGGRWTVTPPSWRADVHGPADLIEEVARIVGYDALPSTPLPDLGAPSSGLLSPRQNRVRVARRALAAMGYAEAVTWSFTGQDVATTFGGGSERLMIENPIAQGLDCMRPSILPNLIQAAARNADRGHPDIALFEIGPVYRDDSPTGQSTAITVVMAPHPDRHWSGAGEDPLYALKGDLQRLLELLGAPQGLQIVQDAEKAPTDPWWHPGRSARVQLGPKVVIAQFGALHPAVLKSLDAEGPMVGFELILEALPEPRGARSKSRGAAALSPMMPLARDFAFVVDEAVPSGDLIRAVQGADKTLITRVTVFDVYRGKGIEPGQKSVAVEVHIQPQGTTLTDAEIEALSDRIVAATGKLGAKLRA